MPQRVHRVSVVSPSRLPLGALTTVLNFLKRLELATRPVHPITQRVLAERWAALPPGVKTREQVLGRNAVGCEGTHGVFPKCNLTCSPCYHSKDANKVRVDGAHTVANVKAQMRLLERLRGPRAHAQLIGGEVSLLNPQDHAAALNVMREHGREPMSMTHGDFDSTYLRALALDEDGTPRFGRLSFAAHFDSLMRGRTGIPRPRDEAELNPFRARFVEMFHDLRRDHGVRSYLAHNMTVTPANLDQIEHVVADVSAMGFSMLSFQPAAHVGDERRWTGGDYSAVGIDDVWERIEAGLGQRVAWQALQFGDPRCNRSAFGARVDGRWVPMFDPDVDTDLQARDRALDHFGGVNFGGTPPSRAGHKAAARRSLATPAISRSRLDGFADSSLGPAAYVESGLRGVVVTSSRSPMWCISSWMPPTWPRHGS